MVCAGCAGCTAWPACVTSISVPVSSELTHQIPFSTRTSTYAPRGSVRFQQHFIIRINKLKTAWRRFMSIYLSRDRWTPLRSNFRANTIRWSSGTPM
jgi:hypothetical protein